MDIKVGEYIRLKDGYIRKYIKRSLDNHIILDEVYEGFKYLTSIEEKEEIVKHSKNIIDLIEVGDWATMNCYGLIIKKVITQEDIWELKTGNYQLLKILTKEKFDSESYEV